VVFFFYIYIYIYIKIVQRINLGLVTNDILVRVTHRRPKKTQWAIVEGL